MDDFKSLLTECAGISKELKEQNILLKESDELFESLILEESEKEDLKKNFIRDLYNFFNLLKRKPVLMEKIKEKSNELFDSIVIKASDAKEMIREINKDTVLINKFADEISIVTEETTTEKIKTIPKDILKKVLAPFILAAVIIIGIGNKASGNNKPVGILDIMKLFIKSLPVILKEYTMAVKEAGKEFGSNMFSVTNDYAKKFTGGISELFKYVKNMFKTDFESKNSKAGL